MTASARLPVGVAAGHPATAEAGAHVLRRGGSAADAAVAAVLTSCVAETIMTGLGGGGFATYWSARDRTATCVDFFVTVPGLGDDTEPGPMRPISVRFGSVPLRYSIGGATVAVPGVPAGCAALHDRWGRLPWRDVVAPAAAHAEAGVAMPHQQSATLVSIAEAMTPGEGALAYVKDGHFLRGGEILRHPGLAETMRLIGDEGVDTCYRGDLAHELVDAVRADGGVLGHEDLLAYGVRLFTADAVPLGSSTVHGRRDLLDTLGTFAGLPDDIAKLTPGDRALAVARELGGPDGIGDTTNIVAVDADGDACVVTTSLGLGSGVWLPGRGVHLNSMLGEGELYRGSAPAGSRVGSMMCPVVVTDFGELTLAAGAAGASRIRTAIVLSVLGVIAEDLPPDEAIAKGRYHRVGRTVHAEPDVSGDVLEALGGRYEVRIGDAPPHYFGGASMVGRGGGGADPRRGGTFVELLPTPTRHPHAPEAGP